MNNREDVCTRIKAVGCFQNETFHDYHFLKMKKTNHAPNLNGKREQKFAFKAALKHCGTSYKQIRFGWLP